MEKMGQEKIAQDKRAKTFELVLRWDTAAYMFNLAEIAEAVGMLKKPMRKWLLENKEVIETKRYLSESLPSDKIFRGDWQLNGPIAEWNLWVHASFLPPFARLLARGEPGLLASINLLTAMHLMKLGELTKAPLLLSKLTTTSEAVTSSAIASGPVATSALNQAAGGVVEAAGSSSPKSPERLLTVRGRRWPHELDPALPKREDAKKLLTALETMQGLVTQICHLQVEELKGEFTPGLFTRTFTAMVDMLPAFMSIVDMNEATVLEAKSLIEQSTYTPTSLTTLLEEMGSTPKSSFDPRQDTRVYNMSPASKLVFRMLNYAAGEDDTEMEEFFASQQEI